GQRHHPRDRRCDGARLRLHERLSRHRQRGRDLDLDARARAEDRGDAVGDPELRRRLHLDQGRRDGRQRDRQRRPHHDDGDLRRPHRRDRLEPRHVVLRPAVELVARADRRRRGCGVRGQRRRRDPRAGPAGEGHDPRARGPRRRVPRRRRRHPHHLSDGRPAAPRAGQPRLPLRPDRQRQPAVAVARHQRRAEDDGHHHARARHPRDARGARPRTAVLGDRVGGDRDRARHLLGRLADHPHDGQPDLQDGPGTGLRRAGRRRGGAADRVAPRLPALDDALDHRRRARCGRGQAPVGGALGPGRQHRRRVGADDPGRGVRRRADLRCEPDLRSGRAGSDADRRQPAHADRGDVRQARAQRPGDHRGGGRM
ncbi:MAG: Probable low-affinity inorganic phosphate transporter, partial [uncultured Solirubrobacteraceae bacterium]